MGDSFEKKKRLYKKLLNIMQDNWTKHTNLYIIKIKLDITFATLILNDTKFVNIFS